MVVCLLQLLCLPECAVLRGGGYYLVPALSVAYLFQDLVSFFAYIRNNTNNPAIIRTAHTHCETHCVTTDTATRTLADCYFSATASEPPTLISLLSFFCLLCM
jgi:hypothetical protein